jgi:hypothetical protein
LDKDYNPYASPDLSNDDQVIEAFLVTASVAGIPLGDQKVNFSGTVTPLDVRRALAGDRNNTFLWGVLIIVACSLLILWIGGLPWPLILFSAATTWFLSFALWRSSSRYRAAKIEQTQPRTFRPIHGWISADRLHVESEFGWHELTWASISGVRYRAQIITLALNPQHAAHLFFPRRFFSDPDWQTFRLATDDLTHSLPFRPRPMQIGHSNLMVNGNLPPLEHAAADSIWLNGKLLVGEVMRTVHRFRFYLRFTCWIFASAIMSLALTWAFDGFESFSWPMVLFWALPVVITVRLVKYVRATGSPSPILSLQAAVSDQCIWMSTPRGVAMMNWNTFGDFVIGSGLILLRETPRSNGIR